MLLDAGNGFDDPQCIYRIDVAEGNIHEHVCVPGDNTGVKTVLENIPYGIEGQKFVNERYHGYQGMVMDKAQTQYDRWCEYEQ